MTIFQLFKRSLLVVASLTLVGFAGCPDYSHLRPEPDYENMVDGGDAEGETP